MPPHPAGFNGYLSMQAASSSPSFVKAPQTGVPGCGEGFGHLPALGTPAYVRVTLRPPDAMLGPVLTHDFHIDVGGDIVVEPGEDPPRLLDQARHDEMAHEKPASGEAVGCEAELSDLADKLVPRKDTVLVLVYEHPRVRVGEDFAEGAICRHPSNPGLTSSGQPPGITSLVDWPGSASGRLPAPPCTTKSMSPGLVVADVLTTARLGLALALPVVLGTGRLTVAAVLVSTAWISDILDGRLARSSAGEGRLGRWDLTADTAVGAGVLVGLTVAGELPVWYAVAALLVLGAWFLRTENFAGSMLLQLAGYVPLLWILWSEQTDWWWLPFVTAFLIGIVDWRRLIEVNIRGFLSSVTPRNWGRVG